MLDNLPVYLDHQATTPLDARVRDSMECYWCDQFGNPHSEGHAFGWDSRRAVELARGKVADTIGADDAEVFFVSGATESCNLALRGIATAAKGPRRRIICLATEHPAVLDTVIWLGSNGFDVEVLPVMHDGIVDLSVVERALTETTLLASVMLANNEIGVIQPVAEVAALCRSVGALIHTDATQAVGRMEVDIDDLGVDLLSFSSHKIYGPKGVGALYIRNHPGIHVEPLMTGGSQECGIRPGTVATPLVVGFGTACEIVNGEWRLDSQRMRRLCDYLTSALMTEFADLRVFGNTELRIPGNLNIGVPGVLGERVVSDVSKLIAISTGSACSTGSPDPSHVLLAIGVDHETAKSSVRISLGRFTTSDHIEIALRALRWALKNNRR